MHRAHWVSLSIMKMFSKYALGALLGMALAYNAAAKSDDKTTYSYPNEYKDKDKDKRIYSVPDVGSTFLLLGASVALLVLSQRKIARVE